MAHAIFIETTIIILFTISYNITYKFMTMIRYNFYNKIASYVLILVLGCSQCEMSFAHSPVTADVISQATLQSYIDGSYAHDVFLRRASLDSKVWMTTDPRNEHNVKKFMYCVKTYGLKRLLKKETAPQYYSLSVIDQTHLANYDNKNVVLLLDFPDEYVEVALRQMPDNTQAYNKSAGSLMRFIHDNLRWNHDNVLYWKKERFLWPVWNKYLVLGVHDVFDRFMKRIDKYIERLECSFIADLDEMVEYTQTRKPSFVITLDIAFYALLWNVLSKMEFFFGGSVKGLRRRLISPAAVIRERQKNSKERSIYFNNEIVVKNGPELTIKGVGLIVRAHADLDFRFTTALLKAEEGLLEYLQEHQLPIVLLPEPGVQSLDQSREQLRQRVPGLREIRPYTFIFDTANMRKGIPSIFLRKFDNEQHLLSA